MVEQLSSQTLVELGSGAVSNVVEHRIASLKALKMRVSTRWEGSIIALSADAAPP
jgi:hypothetical protein